MHVATRHELIMKVSPDSFTATLNTRHLSTDAINGLMHYLSNNQVNGAGGQATTASREVSGVSANVHLMFWAPYATCEGTKRCGGAR